MYLDILAVALALTLTGQIDDLPQFSDLTPCSVVVDALKTNDEAKIIELEKRIARLADQLEQQHRNAGDPGILYDDYIMNTLIKDVSLFCTISEHSTISEEVVTQYRIMRRINLERSN